MRLAAAGAPVVVAMSGGVDSSVAAGLLERAGRPVIGVTMLLWTETAALPAAIERAGRVAAQLGIPHHVVDLRAEFRRDVVDYLLAEYGAGRTPNPCLACNRRIKFGRLLEAARHLGGATLATGHYVRKVRGEGRWHLLRGRDRRKDQSYVLYMLGQAQLEGAEFPLGEYTKEDVRQMAGEWSLLTADQTESQEICFIADDDYRRFVRQYAPGLLRPGPILDRAGRLLGQHQGLALYTIGQRKGLGLTAPEPLYVLELDAGRNAVIVGPARELGRRGARVEQVAYVSGETPAAPFRATAKIRYQAIEADVQVTPKGPTTAEVHFDQPQRDITPGQGMVWYAGEEVLGGGIIAASSAE